MQSSSSGVNGEDLTGSFRRNKRRTLQDMYRPPLDLLFRGSLEAVRFTSFFSYYLNDFDNLIILVFT